MPQVEILLVSQKYFHEGRFVGAPSSHGDLLAGHTRTSRQSAARPSRLLLSWIKDDPEYFAARTCMKVRLRLPPFCIWTSG